MNRLKPYFRAWVISVVSGCSAGLFVIILNHPDSPVVFGSSLFFWGTGGFLFFKSLSSLTVKTTVREDLSAMLQFLAVGFLIYYFLLLFCCWSIAFNKGYVPMIFENIYIHHGPWRFVSHLRLIITGAFLPVFASLILSVISFFIKFNRQSIILAFINCLTVTAHLFSHLWLID